VVGVIPHVIHGQPVAAVKHQPTIYSPLTQDPSGYMSLFVSTNGDPDGLRQQLTDAVAHVDAEVPVYEIRSLRERVTWNTKGLVYIRNLFLIFSLCALLLALVGIYGVMANSIIQRTQEIGMRRALGATDGRVLKWLMRQSWYQLGLGVILGTPLAFVMSQGFVELVGTETPDHNWLFLLIPLLVACVVSLATFIPARRAIRMEPSAALHHE
jgi:ABC-type antimicrobial peptide transport system permease subunit